MRQVRGIVPVLSTPITPEGEIDVEGLNRLVEFLVNKNIGGLWVLGTGSEDMNLTFKKRLKVAEVVAKANKGRVPIILGTGFFAMEDMINFISETSDIEVDAYHVMPYHPLLGLDRVEWMYRRIADISPKPLWMYTSANWSRPIPPQFVERMKNHPNIAGIKFSSRNAVDVLKVTEMACEKFQVITAVASQLYACLCMGSKGHTSSLGSCLPEVLIRIYELYMEGRHEEALKEQHKLNRFLSEWPKETKKDNFLQVAEEKYILSLRGICNAYTTSYYRDLNKEEKRILRKVLDDYGMLDGGHQNLDNVLSSESGKTERS